MMGDLIELPGNSLRGVVEFVYLLNVVQERSRPNKYILYDTRTIKCDSSGSPLIN